MGTRIYTFVKVGGEPYCCDSCAYPAPLQQFDAVGRLPGESSVRQLCEICASTQITDQATQTIAFCTNAMLDQLGKFKGAPVVELPDPGEAAVSRTYQPKIVDVQPRPGNTTATCGPCGKLGNATQSKHVVRVGFTYMRGEDELADVCDEHLAELRKIIHQPGMFPSHWRDDVWRD